MDDKDPPPFGYTFSADFFGNTSTGLENAGPALLNETESQSLMDFFSQGPWSDTSFLPPAEAKDSTDDLNFYGNIVPPASVHSVSTTIPDQSQLHGFDAHHAFAPPQSANNFDTTADDFEAASTLYNNAQIPQPNGRSYSFHGMPSSSTAPNGHHMSNMPSHPMVPTSQGFMNEQLAALLPHHDNPGSVDAELTNQFINSDARQRHDEELVELGLQRPPMKRTYTYGTDSAFNETGFQVSSKHETEEFVSRRLLRELQHAQPLARPAQSNGNGEVLQSPTGHVHFPGTLEDVGSDEDGNSDDATSEEDDDRPSKKRRKSKTSLAKNGKSRKSVSTSGGKNRKASVDDRINKKKRGSIASSKAQRENLSEEQKRSNHILSEQKRRNLIKRGFDELHDLVPEIRNGGLSKSGVLNEAANFLEQLIADNEKYLEILGAKG